MRKVPILAALALGAVLVTPLSAYASSHREAPFVTKNPKVDGTDFYMFNSYETGRDGYVTFIANYQPFQDAWGGPNYFTMDPDALYEIMIDNTGDAKEDITFQFQFTNALQTKAPATVYGVGKSGGLALGIGPKGAEIPIPFIVGFYPIDTVGNSYQNVLESYTINMVTGDRRTGTSKAVVDAASASKTFAKPLDNIGDKTFKDYATYANGFIHDVTIPGCSMPAKVFVGPRAEPFAVNIGPIFDLVNAPASVIANPADRNLVPNPLSCKNITTIALEIHSSCLGVATSGKSKNVIGGWTTASVPQARVINPSATYAEPSKEGGPWTQVSRLAMPLVNEVVVGIPDKDGYNSSSPSQDATNVGFVDYAEYPTLPALIATLFSAAGVKAPATPRADLAEAFAMGVPGVNANGVTAEYMRLNVSIPATPAMSQNNLGAAGCFSNGAIVSTGCSTSGTPYSCDCAGFPNGRRPGDDVVDIELNVAMGYLLPDAMNPNKGLFFHDAVLQDPSQFNVKFPYLTTPTGGASGGTVQACAGPQGMGSF